MQPVNSHFSSNRNVPLSPCIPLNDSVWAPLTILVILGPRTQETFHFKSQTKASQNISKARLTTSGTSLYISPTSLLLSYSPKHLSNVLLHPVPLYHFFSALDDCLSFFLSKAILVQSHTWVMDYDESRYMHLALRVDHNFPEAMVYRISVSYAERNPKLPFEKSRVQPWEFWSHISTLVGSTLPHDCVEDKLS